MPTTANYSWATPVVGGSSGTWGTILNTMFDDIDADLQAVSDVASAAMPLVGGVFTGNVRFRSTEAVAVSLGSLSGTANIRVDDSVAQNGADFQKFTLAGNLTLSFTGSWPSTGIASVITLEITNGGAFTLTWPGAVVWDGASPPTLLSSGVDLVVLYSSDGGTTVRGMHAGSFNS